MGTAARVVGTAAVLAVVFAVAWAAGAAASAPPPRPVSPPPALSASAPAPPAADRVALVDGYRVRLDGELVPGAPSQVFATVTRDGAAVTDLEPYLGAFGHLVALRLSDLTLARVRPDAPRPAPADRAGPGIAFTADVPSSGIYRVYLEFRHAGAVHTATFTLPARELA
jgi:hypothetical protein